MQAGGRVGPVRVDRDDVRVLEPGQRLRLARAGARDLQGDRPVGQLPLLGEEDPGERAPAQLLDQPEPGDRLARLGERRSAARGPCVRVRSCAAEPTRSWMSRTSRSCGGDLGEPGLVLGRVGRLAGLLAEAELLVDQGHERVVGELGVAVAIPLDPDRLAAPPSAGPGRSAAGPAGRRARASGRSGRKSRGVGRALRRRPRQAASNRRARRVAAGRRASSQVRPEAVRLIAVSPPIAARPGAAGPPAPAGRSAR